PAGTASMPGEAIALLENRRLHERPNASHAAPNRPDPSHLVVLCRFCERRRSLTDRFEALAPSMKTGGLNHADKPSHRDAGRRLCACLHSLREGRLVPGAECEI